MSTEAGTRDGRLIPPGSMIGILGGGQLGRMMVLQGAPLGYRFVTLDPADNAPCGQVSKQIVAHYDDTEAASRLAAVADVITYEFENVDAGVAALLEEQSYVPQGSKLLYTTQHRLREKRAIEAAGATVAPYAQVNSADETLEAVRRFGTPCVMKTAMGGYDGKGQFVIRSEQQAATAFAELSQAGTELVVEQFIDFHCELSVIAARSSNGEVQTFPVAENIHVDNILHLSIVPARVPDEVQEKARQMAVNIAQSLDAVGLLAVELFCTKNGELYVNELAPRPHNSGHYTMEACATSQFEQHVRAICGLPLGSTELHTPVVMVNILGEHVPDVVECMLAADENAEQLNVIPKYHLYGKEEAKHKRKMGHINVLCHNREDALNWIEQTNIWRNK
ncbi:5-(carboxyamino)imidazole ribonucleotide synthase [Paenibacillus sp. WLX1005]|uniref:5-(carboxyamino)imidazole ribonucleotide synthase n=1 Tax=Paenibacillus sp. WLX1005 TaxID=3243766 RepID=UPI0039845F4D